MERTKSILGAALLALLAPGAMGWAAAPGADREASGFAETFGLADSRPAGLPDKPARPTPSQKLGLTLGSVPQVALREVDREALLKQDDAKALQTSTKVLRYGIGRAVEVKGIDGQWHDLPDGAKLWVADVVSPGALGLRLHFRGVRLPRGAEVAVYAPAPDGKAAGRGEVESFASDADFARQDGWSQTVFGERARVEVYIPKRAGRRGERTMPLVIDRLQHIYVDPVAKAAGKNIFCHNDVSCHPEWEDVARAVAGIGFIGGEDSLFCTGQLLNTLSQDHTPYWLTAHHCLDSQSEAASAEIFWFYQSPVCLAGPPSLSSVPRSKNTTLLATGASSDFTLLMVEGTLPSGVFWAGWTSNVILFGMDSAGVHHPSGTHKRISFGEKGPLALCNGISGINDVNHVRINWTDGPTEPGSSGSGIFRSDTQQLYGQLHCGPSSCSNVTHDAYGAFSQTYASISGFLDEGSDDASEDNDTCATAKTVSTGTLSSRVVKSTDTDWYRFPVPVGKTVTVTLTFTHSHGDVDAKMYATSCGGPLVDTSAGTTNTEVLTFTNTTGFLPIYVYWNVYLFNDTRNSYTMTVSTN